MTTPRTKKPPWVTSRTKSWAKTGLPKHGRRPEAASSATQKRTSAKRCENTQSRRSAIWDRRLNARSRGPLCDHLGAVLFNNRIPPTSEPF